MSDDEFPLDRVQREIVLADLMFARQSGDIRTFAARLEETVDALEAFLADEPPLERKGSEASTAEIIRCVRVILDDWSAKKLI